MHNSYCGGRVIFRNGSPISRGEASVVIEPSNGGDPVTVEARIEWGQGADGRQYPYVEFTRAEPVAGPE